jgi:hypothetical protein
VSANLRAALALAGAVLVCSLPAEQTGERRVTLDLADLDVGDAVNAVSRACSLNVVLDSAVSGRVSLRFVDAAASEVLAGLASAASLEITQEGSIYRLRPLARRNDIDLNINRGRLSASISGADVREVVAALSEQAHVSMVPEAGLRGTLSASISDVALDEGIRALFQGAGYTVTARRGILQVGMRDSAKAATGKYVPRPDDAQHASYTGSRYDRKGDAVLEGAATPSRGASRYKATEDESDASAPTRPSLASRPAKAGPQPADNGVLPALTPGQVGRKGPTAGRDSIPKF